MSEAGHSLSEVLEDRPPWMLVALWLLFSLPAFWVLPALDDWRTSVPLTAFDWGRLRPGLFWRPLENLNRLLSGKFPLLYPLQPHFLTVAGHGLSAWLVWRLARRLGASARRAAVATSLFLISPAVTAAVWSVDGAIQTWSTACGLGAVLAYLSPQRRRAVGGWLGLVWIGSLWKESALGWFFAAPLLGASRPEGRSPSLRPAAGLLFGLLGFVSYFAVRWAITRNLILSGTERYALTWNPLDWLLHALMLGGVSASTVDTLALLGPAPRYALATASVAPGLPLAALLAFEALRGWSVQRWLLAVLALGALLGPHLPQAHVSELYAYPIVALLAILLAPRGSPAAVWPGRAWTVALLLFSVGALAVCGHKARAMIRTGNGADRVARTIARHYADAPPLQVCLIVPPGPERFGYSVFLAPPGPASDWGAAVRRYWGWRHPAVFRRTRSAEECPSDSEARIAVSFDGEVRFLD